MLMFIIKKYNPSEVTKVFKKLRNCLGDDIFKEMFEVILTDNGWEFSKPADIEINHETGEKLVSLFYTDPYSSWQKGSLERNHEFIRYIIPKGISFEELTKKNVTDMMNHINNVQRKSLDYSTPYSLFKKEYGKNTCRLLCLTQINSNDINLSYKLLIK